MLQDMLKKKHYTTGKPVTGTVAGAVIPKGLWRKCNKCGKPIYIEDVKNNYYTCPKCGGYFRIHAYRRIKMIVDKGSFEEWNPKMEISNPLNFPNYERKLTAAQEKSGLNEAIVIGKAAINGYPAVIGSCDARFLMSSMGHNVGEKICLAIERATKEKLPVILFSCSGGARMQEGIISLMQMAKTSSALNRHHEAGQLFISVLTDPTTGGVTASFAMLGDIILAEPGALIGFAGPRVIRQTIGQKLPEGFQKAEYLLEHGFVDAIVERKALKETLSKLLAMHPRRHTPQRTDGKDMDRAVKRTAAYDMPDTAEETADHERTNTAQWTDELHTPKRADVRQPHVSAWDTVLLSRKADRPVASDYIHALFDDFIELHGDRCYGDDGAIIGGIASFHGIPVTILAQEKGKTTKDNIHRNFGMPSPEGYRKALRLMKQAEVFHRPVICLVDTPGAFCGLEAEERGQGEAIARNLFELSSLKVPVLSLVIGEGGSGGALALAVANEVWMLENAIYSILSPEGFAAILWKDSKKANEAAEVMKITAPELLQLGIIDRIIPEKRPASMELLPKLTVHLDRALWEFLSYYGSFSGEELAIQRYERFRKF